MKTSIVVNKAVDVKPLVFHIGWMRTGTTFLQGLFRQEGKVNLSLKNRFFSYDPYFNRGADYYQQHIIQKTQTEDHLINVDSDENYSMGRFKTQLREAYDIQYNHKSELSFVYHDISEMVLRMKEAAPDAKIFGVVRKQPSWFESVYKHDVYHFGLDQSFAKFYQSELGQAYQKAADYHVVYRIFADAFREENIKIMLFEDFIQNQASFMAELSDFMGVQLHLSNEKKLKKNASTTNLFTLLHRYANRISEKNPAKQENVLYQVARKSISKADRLCSSMHLKLDAEIISKAMQQQMQQQYAISNRNLAAALHLEEKMKKYGYY